MPKQVHKRYCVLLLFPLRELVFDSSLSFHQAAQSVLRLTPPRAVQRSLDNPRNTHMVTSLTEHTVALGLTLSLQVHWLCSFWVTLKSHHLCQSLSTISLFSYQSSFLRLLKAQGKGSEDGTTHDQCSATFPDCKTAPFPASVHFN